MLSAETIFNVWRCLITDSIRHSNISLGSARPTMFHLLFGNGSDTRYLCVRCFVIFHSFEDFDSSSPPPALDRLGMGLVVWWYYYLFRIICLNVSKQSRITILAGGCVSNSRKDWQYRCAYFWPSNFLNVEQCAVLSLKFSHSLVRHWNRRSDIHIYIIV